MRFLVWCGVVAPVLRLSLIALLGLLDTDYSQVRDYISELGAEGAPFADIMNVAGIALVGLLLSLFSVALYRAARPGFLAGLGAAFLTISGLAYVVVGFFPCDPGCEPLSPSTTMRVHLLAGSLAMATQALAPMAIGLHFVGSVPHSKYAATSIVCSMVALIALGVLFKNGLSTPTAGLIQKTFQLATDLWVFLSAIYLLRYKPSD